MFPFCPLPTTMRLYAFFLEWRGLFWPPLQLRLLSCRDNPQNSAETDTNQFAIFPFPLNFQLSKNTLSHLYNWRYVKDIVVKKLIIVIIVCFVSLRVQTTRSDTGGEPQKNSPEERRKVTAKCSYIMHYYISGRPYIGCNYTVFLKKVSQT